MAACVFQCDRTYAEELAVPLVEAATIWHNSNAHGLIVDVLSGMHLSTLAQRAK